MKQLIKWTIWIIVSIILIIIIATVLLSFLIKPNDIKPLISNQIFKATGQRVVFKGDIHWRLFPTLSLKLDDAFINNPPSFNKGVLVKISELSVGVKILPLLHHKVETTELILSNATINLIKNKRGQTNWQAKQQIAPAPQPIAAQKQPTVTKKTAITLQIPVVLIKNMTINWQNNMNGQKTSIKNLNVTAKNIQQNNPFPVQISFAIDNKQPDMRGTISLKLNLSLKSKDQYVLQNLNLKTNLTGKGLPQGKLNSTLQGDAVVSSTSFTLNPLKLQLNASSISGNIAISSFTTLATKFNLTASPFNIDRLSGLATIKGNITAAKTNSAPSLNNLNGTLSINVKNGTYQGVNVRYWLNVAKALRKQEMPPKMQGPNQTTFGNLSASASIKNGIAYTNDLSISSPVIYAKGGGQINLIAQTINYRLTVGSADSNDALLQNIPLIISGALNKPSVDLDKQALLKGALKQQLQNVLNKNLKKLQLNLF